MSPTKWPVGCGPQDFPRSCGRTACLRSASSPLDGPGQSARSGKHALVEHLVARRLVMRDGIHLVAQRGQCKIHALAGAALVAERAMLRYAMPGVVRQALLEVDLRRRIKLLARNVQSSDRDTRRQLLGPQHSRILDGHQERIG